VNAACWIVSAAALLLENQADASPAHILKVSGQCVGLVYQRELQAESAVV
jgi:hypothetical protein